jgi:hypothetical protein
MRGQIGRIGVVARHLVFLDPGQALAGGIGQIGLRRLRIGAARDDQRLPLGVHAGVVVKGQVGQALDLARRLERQRIDLPGQHIVLRAGEIDAARLLVHADQVGHHPVALGQLRHWPSLKR